jgi:hypothetical protein
MSNVNPLPGIGGIIALMLLLSAIFSRKSCDFSCTFMPTTEDTRNQPFNNLTKQEKRAAIEQLLDDPETRIEFLRVISDDQQYQKFLEKMNPDAETIEILEALRKERQIKWEVPDEVPVTVTSSGEVPRFVPAKFKNTEAPTGAADTQLAQ